VVFGYQKGTFAFIWREASISSLQSGSKQGVKMDWRCGLRCKIASACLYWVYFEYGNGHVNYL